MRPLGPFAIPLGVARQTRRCLDALTVASSLPLVLAFAQQGLPWWGLAAGLGFVALALALRRPWEAALSRQTLSWQESGWSLAHQSGALQSQACILGVQIMRWTPTGGAACCVLADERVVGPLWHEFLLRLHRPSAASAAAGQGVQP